MSLWEVTKEVRRLLQQHGNVMIDTDKYASRTCYPILNEAWQDGNTHFTIGDKKDGFYAEATLNPVDAEHREIEGYLGTRGIELNHVNSTQGKVGVEVCYSKGDFNIAAGTEAEIKKDMMFREVTVKKDKKSVWIK